MTDGLPLGWARALMCRASTVMPANMLTASSPMMARVLAALRALGRRNAGTPLLIASTPVSAVQPEANARRTSSRVKIPPTWAVRCSCWSAVAASGSCPVTP